MSIDLVPGPGLRAYVSPASLSPVLLVEDFMRNAGKVTSTSVLPLGGPGEWDQAETCCGTAAVGPDGTTYLWYAGRADATWQIGLATSPDGATFTRHPQNPVLAPGPPGTFDSASVLGPTVIWDERRRLFRMWYEGRDFFGVTRIGHAVSPDGVAWSRAPDNPALDLDALGAVLIGGPDVLPVGDGRLRMWLHVATQEFYRRRIVELANDGTNPAGP